MAKIKPIDLSTVQTYSLKDRTSKVRAEDFGRSWKAGGSLREWLESLPKVLAGGDFREVTERWVQAAAQGKTVILAMGAHPVKVGLSPIILDLLERGIVSAVAMNGAGIIHDAELAMVGRTSEDVAAELGAGSFGMAEETASFLNGAISQGAEREEGLGKAVGGMLCQQKFPHNSLSILASAYERDVPVTVHVAVGTDIIHVHPSADGAAVGKTSHLDFRIFARLVSTLEEGMFINLGSAVIMPEVFLKALGLVRNLGHPVRDFTAVNMDFMRHYRPMTNVVSRPTLEGGKGYHLVGHHEIMFPLLAAAVIEEVGEKGTK
jgi:hypothetical protein